MLSDLPYAQVVPTEEDAKKLSDEERLRAIRTERKAFIDAKEAERTQRTVFHEAMKSNNWVEVERILDDVIPVMPSLRDFDHDLYNKPKCNTTTFPPFHVLVKLVHASVHVPTRDHLFIAICMYYIRNAKCCPFSELLELFRHTDFDHNRLIPMMIYRDAPDEHLALVTARGALFIDKWHVAEREDIHLDEFQLVRMIRLLKEGIIRRDVVAVPVPVPKRWCIIC